MDILSVINDRSSYRGKYEDAPVPREDLKKILEAGLAAPSGCNMQTTSLIAVDDKEILDKLKATMAPRAATAPAAIVVLTERIIAYGKSCFSVQDYSAAIENMLLAIKGLGYESCWYEGYITDNESGNIGRQMADILGVPENLELVCFMPVGKAAEKPVKKTKKPFEERAWFNGFNKE